MRETAEYFAALGLTMLRLYSTLFAWWVAGVLVLVGLSLCGIVVPGAAARAS